MVLTQHASGTFHWAYALIFLVLFVVAFLSKFFINYILLAIMPVRCYGQNWYKYRIRIGACGLICMDLHDRVLDGWSRSDTNMG